MMFETSDSSISISGRYTDAYSVARSTMKMAKLLKRLAIFGAVIVVVLEMLVVALNPSEATMMVLLFPLIVAVLILIAGFTASTLLAAQAQLIAAVIDTAINTSPLVANDQKSSLLESLD